MTRHVRILDPHPTISADKRLTRLFAIVEATCNEQHVLWLAHAIEAESFGYGKNARIPWKHDAYGWMALVGMFADEPVNISLSFNNIGGKLICFWHATSIVVNYDMIAKWFERNVPGYAAMPKSDAANFVNVFR